VKGATVGLLTGGVARGQGVRFEGKARSGLPVKPFPLGSLKRTYEEKRGTAKTTDENSSKYRGLYLTFLLFSLGISWFLLTDTSEKTKP